MQVTCGPVVKTPCFYCRGAGSIPGQESSTCHEVQPKERERKKYRFSQRFLKSSLGQDLGI